MTADDRRAFAPHRAPAGHCRSPRSSFRRPRARPPKIDVVRLPPGDTIFQVLTFPRVHGWKRADVLAREFTSLARLVNEIPVYDVTIPWGPPFRPDVARTLAALVSR
jgi:hypothetical protein